MHEVIDGRPLPYTSALGAARPAARDRRLLPRPRTACDVDPARIIVTAGASAALLLLAAAMIEPGDEVIVGDPSYPCNRQFLASFGVASCAVPADRASTRFQLARRLVRAPGASTRAAVMMATPSNPTGTSIPFDELAAICDLGARARRLADRRRDLPGPERPRRGRPPPHSVLTHRPGRHRHQQLLQVLRHDRLAARLVRPARGHGAGDRAPGAELLHLCPRRPPSRRRSRASRPSRSRSARSGALELRRAPRARARRARAHRPAGARRRRTAPSTSTSTCAGTGLDALGVLRARARRGARRPHAGPRLRPHSGDTHVRLSYAASRTSWPKASSASAPSSSRSVRHRVWRPARPTGRVCGRTRCTGCARARARSLSRRPLVS